MTRPRQRQHLEKFRTRHGSYIYYFRVGKGSRRRLPDDPASAEFEREYAKALIEHLSGTLRTSDEKTIGWLITQYAESRQFASLARETRKQFKYQFVRMREKAAEAPLREIAPE